MRTPTLNVLAWICAAIGTALAIFALALAVAAITRIPDWTAFAVCGALMTIFGMAAFLYLHAFISYRNSQVADHATDILVGIAFAVWAALSFAPWFPDEIRLGEYVIPKSIICILVSYVLYRIARSQLIRKEK